MEKRKRDGVEKQTKEESKADRRRDSPGSPTLIEKNVKSDYGYQKKKNVKRKRKEKELVAAETQNKARYEVPAALNTNHFFPVYI